MQKYSRLIYISESRSTCFEHMLLWQLKKKLNLVEMKTGQQEAERERNSRQITGRERDRPRINE